MKYPAAFLTMVSLVALAAAERQAVAQPRGSGTTGDAGVSPDRVSPERASLDRGARHPVSVSGKSPSGGRSGKSSAERRRVLRAREAEAVSVVGNARREALGGGFMTVQTGSHTESTVTQAAISRLAPSPNPLSFMTTMPGANVANADPFGMAQGNLSVRGMNSDQIGVTLDGVPLNDAGTYMVFPNQYVDTENLQSIGLRPGSSDVDAPVTGASGGMMRMEMADPSRKAGGYADASTGSFSFNREFLRLETGEIGTSGVRAYASISHVYDNHFRGPGWDRKKHADFRLLKEWDNGSTSRVTLTYDDAWKTQYLNPSLSVWHQQGMNANFAGAYTGSNTNFYGLHVNPYRTIVVSAPQHIVLSRNVSLDFRPYLYYTSGTYAGASLLNGSSLWHGTEQVSGAVPGAPDGTFVAFTPTVTPYEYRPGFVSRLNWEAGSNHFMAGYWFDWSALRQITPYSPVQEDGGPVSPGGLSASYRLSDGTRLASYDNLTVTRTNALFISDHLDLMGGRLGLDAGFKEAMVTRVGHNYLPGATPRSGLSAAESLPSLAAKFRIDERQSVFFNAATAFRVPTLNALYDTYSASTGQVVTGANLSQKSEYSISEEAGYRYNGPLLTGSITFFNYNFTNRQIASQVIVNGAQITQNVNAGGQTSRGVDIELGTRPVYGFRFYASAEYLHATTDNNFRVGNDLLPTAGKLAVRSPEFQAALVVNYDRGPFFATVTTRYVGRQFSTLMNDQAMPGYVTADLALGYHLPALGRAHPVIRVNLTNLSNNHYLSGVAGITASSRATRGVYGTEIAAAGAPTYYVGGVFAGIVSLSTSF
ncbi:TonB-dependent receptor [Acetobacter musti]|nr:TonB-dependent receptor [Acetobacter musti]